MQEKSLGQFLEKHIGWVLAILAAVIGIFILLFVSKIPETSLLHHIVRDIGIAFLVATIVATIFEIHARSRFQIETIKGVFDVTMGEMSRPDIWEEVRKHVVSKEIIRERCDIHLSVIPGILGDIPGRTVLELIMSYDAHNLRSQKKTATVRHAVDNHIKSDKDNLPCFTHIEVGKKIYSIPGCLSKDSNGEIEWFADEVELEPKNAEPTRIIIGRKEIMYIPAHIILL